MNQKLLIVCGMVLLGACGKEQPERRVAGIPETASRSAQVDVRNPKDEVIGHADLVETRDGVQVALQIGHLPEGEHGVHIHQNGKCDPPNYTSAGDHFNPFGKHHGAGGGQESHAGDLGNVRIDANGNGRIDVLMKGVNLGNTDNSLLKPGGTALIIHERRDDQQSQPGGDSGARIACGIVLSR